MELTMACGCRLQLDDAASGHAEPRCELHDCTVVARVAAPMPRFRGSPGVVGPLVKELK